MSESLSTPRDHPLAPHLAYTLARKLIDGRLVLFVGAGLSHFASWGSPYIAFINNQTPHNQFSFKLYQEKPPDP